MTFVKRLSAGTLAVVILASGASCGGDEPPAPRSASDTSPRETAKEPNTRASTTIGRLEPRPFNGVCPFAAEELASAFRAPLTLLTTSSSECVFRDHPDDRRLDVWVNWGSAYATVREARARLIENRKYADPNPEVIPRREWGEDVAIVLTAKKESPAQDTTEPTYQVEADTVFDAGGRIVNITVARFHAAQADTNRVRAEIIMLGDALGG